MIRWLRNRFRFKYGKYYKVKDIFSSGFAQEPYMYCGFYPKEGAYLHVFRGPHKSLWCSMTDYDLDLKFCEAIRIK